MKNNKSILAILQLPPPVHGSAIMNNFVYKNTLLNTNFNMKFIHYNLLENDKLYSSLLADIEVNLDKYNRVTAFTKISILLKKLQND